MIKFFWMPMEIWYYVIIPIIVILVAYFLFWLIYRNKKDTYYYNYVVDYVYSTLGIIFCSLLFCLLLGYSIATIEIITRANLINTYLILVIILIVLPIVPACFLVYVIKVYLNNLKRKERLDKELEESNKENKEEEFTFGRDKNNIPDNKLPEDKVFIESEYDLKKKD